MKQHTTEHLRKVSTRFLLLFFFLVLLSVSGWSQPTRRNQISLGAGGTGLFLSTSYERLFLIRERGFLALSVGAGITPVVGGITLPHHLTWNLGSGNSFFEAGLGGMMWMGHDDATAENDPIQSYHLALLAGWRKRFGHDHWTLRIHLSPMVRIAGPSIYEDWTLFPWGGITIGYNF